MDDPPQTSARISSRRAVIMVLVVVHVAIWVVVAAVWSLASMDFFPGEMRLFVLIGIGFGQGSALAVWLALGENRFVHRAVTSGLLLWAIWLVQLMWCFFLDEDLDFFLPIIFAGILLSQFVISFLPLLLLRRFGRWRVGDPKTHSPPSGHDSQFGIRHLLFWTACVALLLGLAQVMLRGAEWTDDFVDIGRIMVNCGWIVCCALFLLLATMWFTLGIRRLFVGVMLLCVSIVTISLVEIGVFSAFLNESGENIDLLICNCVQCGVLFVSLLVVRLAGYRMVRRESAASSGA